MASDNEDDDDRGNGGSLRKHFEVLSREAHLHVLLPKSLNIDVDALLEGSTASLGQLPSRRNIFFDEEAHLQLVLKTSLSEAEVRKLLPYLDLSIAAHATDAIPQAAGNSASASGKYDLVSRTVCAAQGAAVQSASGQTLIVWRQDLHLPRPRVRLQRPAIYFTASVAISGKTVAASRKPTTDHLQAFQALPENALDSLNFASRSSEGKDIYLSADRLTKVAPRAPQIQESTKPIRGTSKRAFPIVPALFTRIRYSSFPDSVIASLHIEASHIVAGLISVDFVEAGMNDDESFKLSQWANEFPNKTTIQAIDVTAWPKIMRAGDEVVSLYRLSPSKYASTTPKQETLSLTIKATVSLGQGSSSLIHMSWDARVDLSQMASERIYKWSPARPGSTLSGHQKQPSTSSLSLHKATVEAHESNSNTETGIIFTFNAPEIVRPNEELLLSVHCVNHSARSRRFALVSLQPKVLPLIPSSQEKPLQPLIGADADLIAGIFNVPPLQHQKSSDVQLLTPDVRIGPLPPGASFETSMTFKVVTVGVLDLGLVRIVDLETRQTVDVKQLPDVISLEP